jgi:histidine ammonia-lyase
MCAAEGIEYRRPLRAGAGVEIAHGRIREHVPRLSGDRSLSPDLTKLTRLIQAGTFTSIASEIQS